MMNKYDQRACIAYAKKEGKEEGLVQGVMQTAKNMLAKGYSVAEVIGVTNLSRKEILALR